MPKRKKIRMVLQKMTRREFENKLTQKLLDMLYDNLRGKASDVIKYNLKWPLYASLRA